MDWVGLRLSAERSSVCIGCWFAWGFQISSNDLLHVTTAVAQGMLCRVRAMELPFADLILLLVD
jgi:hypothetical protein